MSDINIKGEFNTKLKDETFLHFVDNSSMGVLIIQRGYLKYFNKRFTEIFGYTREDILNWGKREFYKIVHPKDLPNLVENFKIEDDRKTVTVQFRGVRKDKKIIPIENYNCHIYYDNKTAYLSSYTLVENFVDEEDIPKLIKTKEGKKIVLDYDPDIVKTLEEKNLKFKIFNYYSYREVD
ncbi:MAG: PAS domain-containing protein [Promethearchaeota archaeon]